MGFQVLRGRSILIVESGVDYIGHLFDMMVEVSLTAVYNHDTGKLSGFS